MKLTKKERKIFEENFDIYEDKNSIELEAWTNGGVDMLIYLGKEEEITATQQFIDYIDNFDIDEEIDIHRQDIRYKNAFSITESVKDFENWLIWLKEIKSQLLKEKTKTAKNYNEKINEIVNNIDTIIIEKLKQYDTSDLEEIIIGLIFNHTFSSKDSIQNLIYTLEKVMDNY